MRIAILCLCLLPAARTVTGAELQSLTIHDAGQKREFVLALDELGLRGPGGTSRVEKSAADSTAELLLAAGRRSAVSGEAAELVYYEKGLVRSEQSRRVLSNKVLVRLTAGTSAAAVAQVSGAAAWTQPEYFKEGAVMTFQGTAGSAVVGAAKAAAVPGVLSAEPLLGRRLWTRHVPNDAYFAWSAANAGYQWHLRNTGENSGLAGSDVNLTTAWDTWKGQGIRIGIIDDGLQVTHPDLSPNVDTAIDYDWNGADNDPSPGTGDDHGTACAGVAAARGDNIIGVTGAAPLATLVGLRLISGSPTDADEAASMAHRNDIIQIKSNSWGPFDSGTIVEGPGVLTTAALANAATTGRGGLGTIFTWAAGNGLPGDDSNFDGYANSIYVIAVAAAGDLGTQADYSEPGANILIAAPSSGNGQRISTTDVAGPSGYNSGDGTDYTNSDYTNSFGGTSSACPLAAGCTALLLQSKPTLGWRDVKEILIRSATKNHPADQGWFDNAAGFHFNDKYGAGLVNASAAVTLAATWTNLGPMVNRAVSLSTPGAAIPDNSTAGAVRTFVTAAAENLRAEQITLRVDIAHSRRGDLEIFVTSPSGTVSHLIRPRSFDTGSGLVWTMSTPQFWGENSAGAWRVRVVDSVAGSTGTLNAATLTIYGTAAPLTPDAALADAIDTSASVFTGGTAGWTRQTTTTHDGIDAAQSGAIGHGQESRMDTTVTGPAAVSFWWRVSCDAGDRLACLVDGVEVASLTGATAWQQHQRTVGAGTHSIVWRYIKDATVSAGSDAGWVDEVTSGPITDPPVITSPLTATGTDGQVVSYQVTASNEPSSFNASGLPAGLAVDTVTGVISGIPSVTGAFGVTISATNDAGTGSAILMMSISDYSGGMAAALDVTGLHFTAPDSLWFSQTAVTHDGQDAARSAAIPDDGSSTLRTTISGPVMLSFWWKVSSEDGYDYLRLLIDGTEIGSMSGEQGWERVTRGIGSGTHTVEWRYTKDGSATGGSDAGWVDQLELIPITQPPVIDSPLTATALIGLPFSYQITATNVPASYNATGLPEGLEVNTSTGVIDGSPMGGAGAFSCTLSASNEFGTGTTTLNLTVADYSAGMNAALDITGLSFTGSGAVPWFNQSATTHDGVDAVQSGLIDNSASSTLTTTVTGPVILSFWWKVSCETDYDDLRLYIDGVQDSAITGEQEWTEVVRGIGSGSHTVEWSFVKDTISSEGSDAGWVDEVRLTPVTQPPVISGPLAVTALAGTPFTYQITASNVPSSYDATGLPAGLTVHPATGLISGTPSVAGIYPCEISATNAIGTGTATLTITLGDFSGLMNTALETRALNYTGAGEAVWFSQAVTTHDGADAAQSGPIDDSSSSSLGVTLTGPVNLSFWWRVSSEANFDYLTLSVDGTMVTEITGEQPWARVTQLIPPGSHTVMWTYRKDGSAVDGADAGWVDQITITPAVLDYVSLTAAGVITGFQEPPLGAANYVRGANGTVEPGWTAGAGIVAQTGNRYPALTGATVGGTTGVKSFVINNTGPVTLRTDAVRLDGFINVLGAADVRTYTTSTTGFESTDNLRITIQVSGDGFLWTSGPDIMTLRTGGSPDSLLPLTATGVAVYFSFNSPANTVPLTVRYARIVVTGQTDSPSEYLVVDNLRFTGTPAPDADGDGFNAFDEAWFGTSDSAATASPLPLLSRTGGATVQFPGVSGRTYVIDTSSDLIAWAATLVTASGPVVSWTDPLAANSPHRYYRVRRP